MTTRIQYEQDIVQELAGRDEALKMLPTPLQTTAVNTTTTIICSTLARGTSNANRYDGRVIKWAEAPDISGPAVGEITGVTDGGFDGTNTLTVNPTITAPDAGESAKDFIMYPKGFGPEEITQAINQVMRDTESLVFAPATLVPDGDMEDAGVARWTQEGSPSTFQKETDSGVFSLLGGRQGLEVVTDAASEGFVSSAFDVNEGKPIYVAALIDAASTGVTFSIQDVNTATAYYSVSITSGKLVLVYFSTTVAASSLTAQIKAISTGTGTFRMGPCWVWDESLRMELSTVSSLWAGHVPILSVERLIGRESALDTDTYLPNRIFRAPLIPMPGKASQPTAVRQTVLELPYAVTDPLLVSAMRPFPTLEDDATTSSGADREYVKFKAIANLLRSRGDNEWIVYAQRATHRARELGYGGKRIQIEAPQTVMR